MIALAVFGAIAATDDGHPLELGGPRQRAVLGMLVAADSRVVSTDRFLDGLWDGEPPPKAMGALQAYVSHLRRVLEPGRLPREPSRVILSVVPGYRLGLPRSDVDAWRFTDLVNESGRAEPAAALALTEEALGLWRDEPYAGYLGQSWADLERTRLTDLHSVAVERRAEAALHLGRTSEAVLSLENHVQRHPLREHAVALLALGLYRLGRQADALARIADARRVLATELGLDPGTELRHLEESVLLQRSELSAPVAAVRIDRPPTPPPEVAPLEEDTGFVGRQPELDRLAAALGRSGPTVVWVESEAGQGKSALLERFLTTRSDDRRIARGRCSEVDGAPPGWVWQQVLADLTPDVSAPVGAFATAQALHEALATEPTTVGLDDLHRADQGTLQILRQLITTGPAGLLVVGTFRGDEMSADLRSTLAATTVGTADRISLAGLEPSAARQLIREQLGADLTQRTLDLLIERSRASPLLLQQLVRVVAADGPVAAERDLPVAVREVLELRLARLPETVVDSLARASVLGREVDIDLLLRLGPGRSAEDELLDALDAGVVAGLVEIGDRGPRFVHALIRDTLYERLPPLRRTRLHQAVLGVLERDQPDALSALAYHASAGLDATTAPRAVKHLRAAADDALAAGAFHDAVAHLRTALRAHRLAGSSEHDTLTTHRHLVRALTETGDVRAARAARTESVAAADRSGTLRDRAWAWHLDLPSLLPLRATEEVSDAAIVALRRVLAELAGRVDGTDGDQVLRARTLLALIREADPWLDDFAPPADEVLEIAATVGDPLLTCQGLNAQYLSPRANEQADFLTTVGEQMLTTARSAGLPPYEALAASILAAEAVGRGDLPEAERLIAHSMRVCSTAQLHLLLVTGEIFASTRLLLAGRLAAARASFERVTRQLAVNGDPNAAVTQLFCDFTVAYAGSDTSPLLERLRAFAAERPRNGHDLLITGLLDAGDTAGAAARYDPHPWQEDATWMFSTSLAVHNAYRLGDPSDAARAYSRLLPWSGQLSRSRNGALVLGPVDFYLGLAAALAGRSREAERHLHRAGRQTATFGPPAWRARVKTAQESLGR